MRHIAFAAVLLCAGIVTLPVAGAFAPSAAAQGRDDDRKKDDEKRKKEKERERVKQRETALKAIGSAFAAKDIASLLARVPKDAKIQLTLGGDDGEYAVDQARGVLDKYFGKFERLSVEFKTAEDDVGSFTMTLRRKGEDKELTRKLYVKIKGPDASGRVTLVALNVDA